MIPKQETFDTVVKHLLTQNAKATATGGACRYRGFDDRKCAAGCLIPDDEYRDSFEGMGVCWPSDDVHIITVGPVGQLIQQLGHDLQLVRELQLVHDNYDVSRWKLELQEVAKRHDLSTNEIST